MADRDRLNKLRRLKELRLRSQTQQPGQPVTVTDPTADINVAEELSGTEQFLAGAGKGIVDVGRGVEQAARGLVPGISPREEALQREIDESKRLDQPLLETGPGVVGAITGGIAASVPALAIPGGATLAGGTAVGAGLGALSPVATDESRLTTTAKGAAGGALGTVASKAFSKLPSLAGALKKAAGKLIPTKLPERLFERSVKFRPSIPTPQRDKLVNTALNEGIAPTEAGLTKLTQTIEGLNTQIDELINNATAKGVTIPKSALFRELKNVRQEIGGVKFNASKDVKRLNRIVGQFDEQLKALGKDSLSPTEVQAFKKDLYQRINFDAKQGSSQFLNQKVEKALARSARKAVGEVDPLVNALNKREGDLIALRGELPQSVNRIANRNIIGLDTAAKIGAGAVVGGSPGAAGGAIVAALGAPLTRAQIAIALRQADINPIARSKILPALLRLGGAQAPNRRR